MTNCEYRFGPWPLPMASVFYESEHTLAFVNLCCFQPGHVLVIPKQCYIEFVDIPDVVRDELAITLQFVVKMLRQFYAADSIQIAFQNGASAGMTVCHHHFHVIPFKKGEYPGYLPWLRSKFTEDGSLPRKSRDRAEMNLEATVYRNYIKAGMITPVTPVIEYLLREDIQTNDVEKFY